MSFPLFLDVVLKDKMDSIMCVTMATNLAELRHFYSHEYNIERKNLVRSFDCVTSVLSKLIPIYMFLTLLVLF